MSGELHVRLATAGFQEDAVVACEVIGGPERTTQSMPMQAGQTAVLDVPQGIYLVRAVLPSGEQLSSTTEVRTDQPTTVTLAAPAESPATVSVPELLNAVLPRSLPLQGPSADQPIPLGESRRLWLRLWRDSGFLPWHSENLETKAGRMTAVLSQSPQTTAVQVCGEGTAWRVACLPPAQQAVVTVVLEDSGAGFHDGVRVETSGRYGLANSILGYLTSGQLDQARVVAPELVTRARRMFEEKVTSPEGAAIAGYFLLRIGEQDSLGDWPANFANWFGWLPDAQIIHAWQLLRRPGAPDRRLARSRLLHAAQSGPPRYTEGLRLLFEGLQAFAAQDPNDAEVAALLAHVRGYAAACDWGSGHTTYWARSPDVPTLERITGRPDDHDSWLEVDVRI
jgi:hypothetical protein